MAREQRDATRRDATRLGATGRVSRFCHDKPILPMPKGARGEVLSFDLRASLFLPSGALRWTSQQETVAGSLKSYSPFENVSRRPGEDTCTHDRPCAYAVPLKNVGGDVETGNEAGNRGESTSEILTPRVSGCLAVDTLHSRNFDTVARFEHYRFVDDGSMSWMQMIGNWKIPRTHAHTHTRMQEYFPVWPWARTARQRCGVN